jgi:secreted trypsin-like serine protease
MKRFAALALFACAAACNTAPSVGERSAGIINGTTDTGDPGVVLVLAQVSQTMGSLCTGEVISPHVVLTAAHCLDPDVLMTTTAKFAVFTGTTLSQSSPSSEFLTVKETHFDSAFDPQNPQNGHDVGVVILANPTTITPIPYNRVAMTQTMVGQAARFVGFGVTSGTDTMGTSAGTRRQAPTKLASLDDLLLGFQDAQHGICEGDSGGPALMTINGTEVIVGITSFGLQGCPLTSPQAGFQAGNDTRVDKYIDFIDMWVTMFDPPAKGPGEQCSSDADCAPRSCQQTSVGKICVQNCDPAAMPSTCPAGTQCTNVDGTNLCDAPMSGGGGSGGGKGGGCAVAAGTNGGAPLAGAGLLLCCVIALALRRRARA